MLPGPAEVLLLESNRLCSPGIGLAGGAMPGLENPLSKNTCSPSCPGGRRVCTSLRA